MDDTKLNCSHIYSISFGDATSIPQQLNKWPGNFRWETDGGNVTEALLSPGDTPGSRVSIKWNDIGLGNKNFHSITVTPTNACGDGPKVTIFVQLIE